MEELLTALQVAQELKLDVQTVRRKIRAGKIFAYRPEGEKEYRVPRGAIQAYLTGQTYISPNNKEALSQ